MNKKQKTYVLYAVIAIVGIPLILAYFGVIGPQWGFIHILILAALSIGIIFFRGGK